MLCGLAQAGSGPWVVARGQTDLYVGLDEERISELAISTGSFAKDDLVPVGEGLSKLTAKGIVSYGLLPNLELEAQVPWMTVRANRDDAALCGALGLQACQTTQGLGVLRVRTKWQLWNELYDKPLSVSVGVETRYGDLTAATRARLTNLGEGTFDLGPTLALGRSGGLGEGGYWYSFLDAGWRYRVPLVVGDVATGEGEYPRVPGSELYGELDWIAVPGGKVGIGPAFLWFSRPRGQDFEEVDLTDPDRFGRLSVLSLEAGGKLTVRSGEKLTLSASVFRTVYAVNNPISLDMALGLSVTDLGRRAD